VRPAGGDGRGEDRGGGLAPSADRGLGDARGADPLPATAERLEELPDRLLVYAHDGDAALADVAARGIAPESALVRRSSLEDVFLRLTGRQLVD
jgi:lipooligosaccharide transport system ATP-binding protein